MRSIKKRGSRRGKGEKGRVKEEKGAGKRRLEKWI